MNSYDRGVAFVAWIGVFVFAALVLGIVYGAGVLIASRLPVL